MTQLVSLADVPGTSREYETIYILRPNITNDEVAEVNTKVRTIIEGMGGKIIKVDNWGKRRLAYEVKKERKGIYLYWQYLAGPGVVDEFERNMRMLDSVIRYMTVKLDTDIDPEARPSEVTDETYEKAATTAADEEDMFLRHHGDSFDDDEDHDDDDDDDDRHVRRSRADSDSDTPRTASTDDTARTDDTDDTDDADDADDADDTDDADDADDADEADEEEE